MVTFNFIVEELLAFTWSPMAAFNSHAEAVEYTRDRARHNLSGETRIVGGNDYGCAYLRLHSVNA